MERKKSTALGGKALRQTEDQATSDKRQLRPTTRKIQKHGHASEKRQSKTQGSRAHKNSGYDQDMEFDDADDDDDDDDDSGNDGEGGEDGEEDNSGRDESINETNVQITSDGHQDVEDVRNDGDVESESESFLETYGTFRAEINKASRREAEKEFLRCKRELIALPERHKQNAQQEKAHRFCTWALRQVKRRIDLLKGEEAARVEGSSSDGLSESDDNKRWKMYGIIAEDKTQYLIAWKGVDNSGQDYGDEWTAKKNVVRKDRREWEAYRLENAEGSS